MRGNVVISANHHVMVTLHHITEHVNHNTPVCG